MLGIGFRRALEVLMRGTPWITRGSLIKVGSSFAGTFEGKLAIMVRIEKIIDKEGYFW